MEVEGENGGSGVHPPPKPPDGSGVAAGSKISFRDKLMGAKEPLPRREKVDLLANKMFKIE